MKEYLDVVDENDKVIGKADWDEVRSKNLLHRGTAVFIFNSKKELFVHKRSKTMKKFPSEYAMVVGGGVSAGESYEDNAERELYEETGIKGVKLNFLFKTFFNGNGAKSFIKVYSCLYDGDIKLQEEEIEEGFFVSLNEINKIITQKKFTEVSLQIFDEYMKKYHKNDPAIKGL